MKNAASLALIFFVFTVNTKIMAQGKDSMPAKKVAEKGAKGDLILGKQNKKKQLNASPQLLNKKIHSIRKNRLN